MRSALKAIPQESALFVRGTVADLGGAGRTELGGKALHLARLTASGFPVPAWFCVTSAAFRGAFEQLPIALREGLAELERTPAHDVRALAERASHALRENLFAGGAEEALRAECRRVLRSAKLVAVRSSASGEDSAEHSFAGQMETYLYVPIDEVTEKARACIASSLGDRALLYRRARKIGTTDFACAAVIQTMVDAVVSGVLFTANPQTRSTSEMVVVAAYGLGEGVVDGAVPTDTYLLDAQSGATTDVFLAEKVIAVGRDPTGGGTSLWPVDAEIATKPALSPKQLAELAALGRRAAATFGAPQDVEWAIDGDGRIWILQSRPISTLGRETLFDNANIVESFPGVCTPLTFSIARAGYEQVFRESARAQGMPEDLVREDLAMHANLLAFVDGRIYYNLTNWYKRFDNIPGAQGRVRAMEKALGLAPRPSAAAPLRTFSPAITALYKARAIVRRVTTLVQLRDRVESYLAMFRSERARFMTVKLETLEAHALLELAERVTERLLAPYLISIANDGYSQVFFQALGDLLARWGARDPRSLANELLCGERDMESVAPVRSMIALVARVAVDSELRSAIEDGDAEHAWRELQRLPKAAALVRAIEEHIEKYGDRVLHELKIESSGLDEQPSLLVSMIRNYLRAGVKLEEMQAREQRTRHAAERALARVLAWHPVRAAALRFVLEKTRTTIVFRENLRLARSRGMGMLRRVYRMLGRRLAEAGVLEHPSDIVFLAKEEVAGIVRGASVTRDVRALVALRKSEHVQNLAKSPPPRFSTRGIVAPHEAAKAVTQVRVRAADGVYRGIGCGGSIVRGRVRIVTEPRADLAIKGEILVAPATDPGWVFLMISAGGLISEKGSLLSHTAIIGRELGIPTVVGIRDITRLLSDGDFVEIDGRLGTVRVLSPAEAPC